MTADIKLLPLPEPANDVIVDDEGNETFLEFFADYQMQDYASANVAHATEPLKAEIEALRVRADAMAGEAIKHEARAERLAEALREVVELDEEDGDSLRNARAISRAALRDHDQEEGSGAFWGSSPKSGGPDWTGFDG